MTLTQAWLRRVVGAGMATVILPLLLLGALAVAAFGGGLSGLGGLGQALSGPPVPAAAPGAGVLARLPSAPLPAASTPATGRSGGRRFGGLSAAPAGGAGAVTGAGTGSPVTTGAVAPAVRQRSPGAGPPGGSHGASAPNPVDDAAAAGEGVSGALPAPVGPAVSQTLGTVATTVDGILPPH